MKTHKKQGITLEQVEAALIFVLIGLIFTGLWLCCT
jgi:hypothetical protein